MNDMTELGEEARALAKKFRAKRESLIKRMIAAGKGPSAIGRELGISRQRAQQIIKRLDNDRA